jgi:hypothetical protein
MSQATAAAVPQRAVILMPSAELEQSCELEANNNVTRLTMKYCPSHLSKSFIREKAD